jgi:hypothetical protein
MTGFSERCNCEDWNRVGVGTGDEVRQAHRAFLEAFTVRKLSVESKNDRI